MQVVHRVLVEGPRRMRNPAPDGCGAQASVRSPSVRQPVLQRVPRDRRTSSSRDRSHRRPFVGPRAHRPGFTGRVRRQARPVEGLSEQSPDRDGGKPGSVQPDEHHSVTIGTINAVEAHVHLAECPEVRQRGAQHSRSIESRHDQPDESPAFILIDFDMTWHEPRRSRERDAPVQEQHRRPVLPYEHRGVQRGRDGRCGTGINRGPHPFTLRLTPRGA